MENLQKMREQFHKELCRAGKRIPTIAALLATTALLIIAQGYVSSLPFADPEIFVNYTIDNFQIFLVLSGVIIINFAYLFVTLYAIPGIVAVHAPPVITVNDPVPAGHRPKDSRGTVLAGNLDAYPAGNGIGTIVFRSNALLEGYRAGRDNVVRCPGTCTSAAWDLASFIAHPYHE